MGICRKMKGHRGETARCSDGEGQLDRDCIFQVNNHVLLLTLIPNGAFAYPGGGLHQIPGECTISWDVR